MLTRRDFVEKKHGEAVLPPCVAEYLVAFLYEVGPLQMSGKGGVPISHTEIAAWQRNTGIRLNAWEARLLRRLSSEYHTELVRAESPDHPAPWTGAPYYQSAKAMKALRMKSSIRGMREL